jgi:hypothetical protein
MRLCAVLFLLTIVPWSAWAADLEAFPDLDIHDSAALQEASRVLEEEIKLAARPQPYVLIDLAARSIHIKGRGIELQRLPIQRWSATSEWLMTGSCRLLARPAVVRRKIDPNKSVEQDPISLADMPVQYGVACLPSLALEVLPPPSDHPLLWSWASSRMLWRRLKARGSAWLSGPPPQGADLLVTMASADAQSLAWALVDGMPIIIRRATSR